MRRILDQILEEAVRQQVALDMEVEHFALVIDCPPQPVFSFTDLYDHLVEMPARARTAAFSAHSDHSGN